MTSVRVSAWIDPAATQVERHHDDDGTPWAVVDFDAHNGARLALFLRSFDQVDALEAALGEVREHLTNDNAASDAA